MVPHCQPAQPESRRPALASVSGRPSVAAHRPAPRLAGSPLLPPAHDAESALIASASPRCLAPCTPSPGRHAILPGVCSFLLLCTRAYAGHSRVSAVSGRETGPHTHLTPHAARRSRASLRGTRRIKMRGGSPPAPGRRARPARLPKLPHLSVD